MRYNLFVFVVMLSCDIIAAGISHEIHLIDAKNIVTNFETNNQLLSHSRKTDTTKCTMDAFAVSHINGVQLFIVQKERGGYYVVSTIDQVQPVLAYSEDGYFYEDELHEEFRGLLSGYEMEIAYIRDSIAEAPVNSEWEAYFNNVLPMDFSQEEDSVVLDRLDDVCWGQTLNNDYISYRAFYNQLCPTISPTLTNMINRGHAYVGCTAVAMAQVMWYWGWPYAAMIPDSIEEQENYSNTTHTQVYNWDKMPLKLLNSTPIDMAREVQTLLRDCGYVSKMEYGANSSGATLRDAKCGLQQFLNYEGMTYHEKSKTIFWSRNLKREIDAGRPIIYAGYTKDKIPAGHTFVVYGYKGNFFKVNWGWRNNPKTWVTLDYLVSDENYNFTSDQEAVWGIEPNYLCSDYIMTSMPEENSVLMSGGTYDLSMNITPNKSLICFSGTEIRLLPGFNARRGCSVQLGIKEFPCSRSQSRVLPAPGLSDDFDDDDPTEGLSETTTSLSPIRITPNPVRDVLHVDCNEEIISVDVYSAAGQYICHSTHNDMDVSSLSKGTYVLRVTTATSLYCALFIKQ